MGLKEFSWVEEGIRQELSENYQTKTRLGHTHKWRESEFGRVLGGKILITFPFHSGP